MWAVIGGQLGFIQLPGDDSGPARSDPGIAQQLCSTYNRYLQHFEIAYILAVESHQFAHQVQLRAAGVLPLDKQRFESTYAHFCRSQNTSPRFGVPIGDNRVVDLHRLHVCVMYEGGGASVSYLGTTLFET